MSSSGSVQPTEILIAAAIYAVLVLLLAGGKTHNIGKAINAIFWICAGIMALGAVFIAGQGKSLRMENGFLTPPMIVVFGLAALALGLFTKFVPRNGKTILVLLAALAIGALVLTDVTTTGTLLSQGR